MPEPGFPGLTSRLRANALLMPLVGSGLVAIPRDRETRRGRGFFDAPWWRLLLWALVLIVALLALEYLGILG